MDLFRLSLAGKALFEVPQAASLYRQEALDWYTQSFNQMLKQIDNKLPISKQLELLEKAGEALRRASEIALIDPDAKAEFAERVFRPSLDQLTDKLGAALKETGEALQAKLLEAMRQPAVGCFVAGTLVHTKDGLKPIEQIKVGDWVLSRPENPEQGKQTAYKRVVKTFRFEDKEVIRFWWCRNEGEQDGEQERVYATPNHPVWLNPNGWVAMGRLHLPGKHRPGTIHRGDDEWLRRELELADGGAGSMLDISDLYRTDRPTVAFIEEDDWGLGALLDFSSTPPVVSDDDLEYDYESWGDAEIGSRERYTATVFNIEVEDWHTYFVGRTGLWVHNQNCLMPWLGVGVGKGDVKQLLHGTLAYTGKATGKSYQTLTKAELNAYLLQNPSAKTGVAVIRMDGASKYADELRAIDELPNGLKFEDDGLGRLIDIESGLRYEYAVLINKDSWAGESRSLPRFS